MDMFPTEYLLQRGEKSFSSAESKLFQIFKNVQNTENWVCFHSLSFVSQQSTWYIDRELDFIIFIPNRGILFIEVKGGGIKFFKETKTFTTTNREGIENTIKDPLKQVSNAKYDLSEKIYQEWNINIKSISAISLIFPDCNFDTNNLPHEYRDYTIIEKDLQNLHSKFISILPNLLTEYQTSEVNKIIEKLKPKNFISEMSFNSLINYHATARNNATNEQRKFLSFLSLCNNAILNGVAGSGKTVLALAKVLECAKEYPSKKVLYVCYTKILAENIRKKLTKELEIYNNLEIHTYNELAKKLLKDNFPLSPNDTDWEENIPKLVLNFGKIYSVICVDEVQDFTQNKLLSLKNILLSTENCFWLFGDKNQTVLNKNFSNQNNFEFTDFFDGNYVFPLFINCRNPLKIGKYAYKALKYEQYKISSHANEGLLNFVQCSSYEEQAKKLQELIKENNYKSEHVIIISMKYMSKSSDCSLFSSKYKQNYYRFEEKHYANSQFAITNIQNYKGLEKEIVILVDVDENTNLIDLYTASTRALAELHVFYMNDPFITAPTKQYFKQEIQNNTLQESSFKKEVKTEKTKLDYSILQNENNTFSFSSNKPKRKNPFK